MTVRRVTRSLLIRSTIAGGRLRGLAYRLAYAAVWTAAPGLFVGRDVRLELYGDLRLGRNVKLSDGCCLGVGPGGTLTIGDDVFVGRHTVIVATEAITIGAGVDIAEHCTIRDSDHALRPERRAAGGAVMTPIEIGARCWLGAGARVLRGSQLGAGVVVGANAVVKGTFEGEVVIAGAPARVIKKLEG
jgi:acetyltransferase-like isoleucine patch superfamily enzyme